MAAPLSLSHQDQHPCLFFEDWSECGLCAQVLRSLKDRPVSLSRRSFQFWYKTLTKIDDDDDVIAASRCDWRRLYNRRSSLSESRGSTSSSCESSPTSSSWSSSAPASPTKHSWVEAPEFVPAAFHCASPSSHDQLFPDTLQQRNEEERGFLEPYQGVAKFMMDYIKRRHEAAAQNSLGMTTASTSQEVGRTFAAETVGPRFYRRSAALAHPGAGPPAAEQRNKVRRSCIYCIRKGMNESMYDSHCLRNPLTKILMCPELKARLCRVCKDTGDDRVHASDECTKV